MNHKAIIVLLLFILACGKRPSDTIPPDNADTVSEAAHIQTHTSTVAQQNYKASEIYRDIDNDSLLLDVPELTRLVTSFTSKLKIRETEYGVDDYTGKYRVYAEKLDTLVIDKGDARDYGFGSTIYLKRNDSIILYRSYEVSNLASDSGQFQEVTEQWITFANGTMTFKQRQMKTTDWSQLKFSVNFETIKEDPAKRYALLKHQFDEILRK